MVNISMIGPTSFMFFWESSSQYNSTYSSLLFELSCCPLLYGISTLQPEVTEENMVVLSNLIYGVTYNCSIYAVEHGMFSAPTYFNVSTAEIGINNLMH